MQTQMVLLWNRNDLIGGEWHTVVNYFSYISVPLDVNSTAKHLGVIKPEYINNTGITGVVIKPEYINDTGITGVVINRFSKSLLH